MTPDDAMIQAPWTANHYMREGAAGIAAVFDAPFGSRDHLELCKAILPAYILACNDDFKTALAVTGSTEKEEK